MDTFIISNNYRRKLNKMTPNEHSEGAKRVIEEKHPLETLLTPKGSEVIR